MEAHHFAARAPGGSVFICVGFAADAGAAATAETDFSSDCFFSDSLIERRNSSISTFGRTNCFGAAVCVVVVAGEESGISGDAAASAMISLAVEVSGSLVRSFIVSARAGSVDEGLEVES